MFNSRTAKEMNDVVNEHVFFLELKYLKSTFPEREISIVIFEGICLILKQNKRIVAIIGKLRNFAKYFMFSLESANRLHKF